MYLGYYDSVVTEKNQLTFPSKLLKQTGKKLLITRWFENSIIVLPEVNGQEILKEAIKDATSLLPEARDLMRFFFSNAIVVDVDSKSRFVLPKNLREYANIGHDAVFLGVNAQIELWDKKVYENYGAIREAQIRETAIQHYTLITKQNSK